MVFVIVIQIPDTYFSFIHTHISWILLNFIIFFFLMLHIPNFIQFNFFFHSFVLLSCLGEGKKIVKLILCCSYICLLTLLCTFVEIEFFFSLNAFDQHKQTEENMFGLKLKVRSKCTKKNLSNEKLDTMNAKKRLLKENLCFNTKHIQYHI